MQVGRSHLDWALEAVALTAVVASAALAAIYAPQIQAPQMRERGVRAPVRRLTAPPEPPVRPLPPEPPVRPLDDPPRPLDDPAQPFGVQPYGGRRSVRPQSRDGGPSMGSGNPGGGAGFRGRSGGPGFGGPGYGGPGFRGGYRGGNGGGFGPGGFGGRGFDPRYQPVEPRTALWVVAGIDLLAYVVLTWGARGRLFDVPDSEPSEGAIDHASRLRWMLFRMVIGMKAVLSLFGLYLVWSLVNIGMRRGVGISGTFLTVFTLAVPVPLLFYTLWLGRHRK